MRDLSLGNGVTEQVHTDPQPRSFEAGQNLRLWPSRERADQALALSRQYLDTLDSSIRLHPAEGLMSPRQAHLAGSRLQLVYTSGQLEDTEKNREKGGVRGAQEIYRNAQENIARSWGQHWSRVNMRFNSGMDALRCAIEAYSGPDGLVLTIQDVHGGQPRTAGLDVAQSRRMEFLPFNEETHEIDVTRLDRTLEPDLVLIDHSNVLRPHDIAGIRKVYPDAIIVVDVSHIYLPIVGGQFTNPFDQGADVIIGSTHKSANGPAKAISIAISDDLASRMRERSDVEISLDHLGAIAALDQMACEHIEFGARHAACQVLNANELAHQLSQYGVPVYAFSKNRQQHCQSSHVWVDCEKIAWAAEDAIEQLENAGIITHALYLPRGGRDSRGAAGLRFGSTEVTRLGMGLSEMAEIASFIKRVLIDREDPSQVCVDTKALKARFREIQFCFRD